MSIRFSTLACAAALILPLSAHALTCGVAKDNTCEGTAFQYAGGFNPQVGEAGGFGGAANCIPSRTPVVFVHGNTDNATSWDVPPRQVPGYPVAPKSVYQQFKDAGYKDCELFGVTYLNASQRAAPQLNYHSPATYEVLDRFIEAVKAYTKKDKVDIVSHSLGVSMSLATLTTRSKWGNVRRFVNIAGALHGLDSCYWTGYANPLASTCGSQNWYDPNVFGFYPNYAGLNAWTGTWASYALSNSPAQNPNTAFYTIYAGSKDEVMCTTASNYLTCGNSPLFPAGSNVKAQVNVGAGSNTLQINWDWTLGMPVWNQAGGDKDGVGHFLAKNNTGSMIVRMLTTTCTTGCASTYLYGPAQVQ